jgi:hypothetical protein
MQLGENIPNLYFIGDIRALDVREIGILKISRACAVAQIKPYIFYG